MFVASAMMCIGSNGHPVRHTRAIMHTQSSEQLGIGFAETGFAKYNNQIYEIVRGDNSMCARKKDSNSIQNVATANGCDYGCDMCIDFCNDHGYGWHCCDGGWCCCFKTSGPCQRSGSACNRNYC